MSYRKEHYYAQHRVVKSTMNGVNFSELKVDDLSTLWKEIFEKGMHGICFSAYEEGQSPGQILQEDSVRQRMKIISPHTKWVRSFSCIEGNELIPKIAKEFGLKTLVGAWLGPDKALNEEEILNLIDLGKKGYVDIAAVGNEVMYRGDLSEEELLEYIYRVKKALPNLPVGYVDAYYEFSARPKITEACDVILANCYPFWEGCHIDYSLIYMKEMFHQALHSGGGKKVIITETGWPSGGGSLKASESGQEQAMKYFINAQKWSAEEDIEMFYFSSFDESWKTDSEGGVGAYWGLWDKQGNLKF